MPYLIEMPHGSAMHFIWQWKNFCWEWAEPIEQAAGVVGRSDMRARGKGAAPRSPIGQKSRSSNCPAAAPLEPPGAAPIAVILFLRSPLQTMLSIFCTALNHSLTATSETLDWFYRLQVWPFYKYIYIFYLENSRHFISREMIKWQSVK